MSVLIKGMEMPKDCAHCSFQGFGGRMNERILCMLTGTNDYINQQSKFEDCPLIEVPSADVVEVKRGVWVLDDPKQFITHCSNCNWINVHYAWGYCPNCGADMRGGT